MLDIQGDWNRRLNYSGTIGDTKREILQREQELCIDERPPTQIFKEQISAGFFCDFVGVKAMAGAGHHRQHHDRDGLPAHRLDLAGLPAAGP